MPIDRVSRSGFPLIRIDPTLPLPAGHPGDAEVPHEPFDGAAGRGILPPGTPG